MKTRDTLEALIVETDPKPYRPGWQVGEGMPKFEPGGVGPCVVCGLASTLDKATVDYLGIGIYLAAGSEPALGFACVTFAAAWAFYLGRFAT